MNELDELIKLNKQMEMEHDYFEEYKKHKIPFIVIPIISPEHHSELLEYRDKLIDGVNVKFVFEA